MFNKKYSNVALALLALSVSACGQTIGQPVPVTASPAAVTPTASPAAVTPASPEGPAATPPVATPAVGESASGPAPRPVVLSGTIYDEAGAPVDGAMVTVHALDANVKYDATVQAVEGSYVVNGLPEGVNVEVQASKAGWTSRRRVGSFQADATVRNQMDFGTSQAGGTADAGAAYFISRYPEVAKTEPAFKATGVDPSTLTYKLTLSEPLDEANRRRFEDALRVFPANRFAAPNNGNFQDLQDSEDATRDYNPDDTAQWAYSIKKGSLFLAEPNTRASVSWDATGTVATLSFHAPLVTDRNDTAKYEVGLVAGANAIVDGDNNALGTDKSGALGSQPAAGNLIRHAFVPASLALDANANTAAKRWTATHTSVSVFSVVQDAKAPTLAGVAYTKNLGADSRFELTFDEPMAAYDGSLTGRLDPNWTNGAVLDGLTFATSDRTGGTANVTLRGTSPQLFGFTTGSPQLASATDVWGTAASTIEREFKLDKAAFTATPRTQLAAPADRGKLVVEANPNDPKMVFVYVIGRTNLFDTRMVELKARLEGAADPAGNAIRSADADAHQVTSAL